MRRRRRLVLFAVSIVLVSAMFVRVGYKSVGWGGYIHIDIVNPWKR